MAKSQQTFNKKEREKKKRKKKQDKIARRAQRKLEREAEGKKSFDEQLSYIDENGNLVDTPPDPAKKFTIKAEDILLGVPSNSHMPQNKIRTGKVKFFNEEKAYGFITDKETKDQIFVHINNCKDQIKENYKVQFELSKGPKGPTAINVEVLGNS